LAWLRGWSAHPAGDPCGGWGVAVDAVEVDAAEAPGVAFEGPSEGEVVGAGAHAAEDADEGVGGGGGVVCGGVGDGLEGVVDIGGDGGDEGDHGLFIVAGDEGVARGEGEAI